MELKLIDFNAKFMKAYMQWCVEHPEEAAREETAEELYYTMYEDWLKTPKSWLDGKSPESYFADIGDAQMYVSAWIEYTLEEIELPDPLIDCMLKKKEEVYPILLGILFSKEIAQKTMRPEDLLKVCGHAVRMIALIGKPHPYKRYIALLKEQTEDSLFLEEVAEVLTQAGAALEPLLMDAYAATTGEVKKTVVDVLSHLPSDGTILNMLLGEFAWPDADIAFLAGCLGRLGDERALAPLKAAADKKGLQYYEFKEIRNAVEQISGEEMEKRDFPGDSLYDFLKEEENGL